MKCPQCRTLMQSQRVNHRYTESGLPNVVLMDVEVRSCPECGERAVVLPRIESLHRSLAMTIIRQPGRLTPHEIRFLRKWRGWSGADFARHMGVDPATVSRWERAEDPQAMGPTAERLLRMAVAHGEPTDAYPVAELAKVDSAAGRPELLRMRAGKTGWEAGSAVA